MTTPTLFYWLTGMFLLSSFAVGMWFLTMSEERASAMAAKSGKPADIRTYRTMGIMILVSAPIVAGMLLYAGLSGMVG